MKFLATIILLTLTDCGYISPICDDTGQWPFVPNCPKNSSPYSHYQKLIEAREAKGGTSRVGADYQPECEMP